MGAIAGFANSNKAPESIPRSTQLTTKAKRYEENNTMHQKGY